ncbi:MAG: HEAT repeat domain-containing protein [Candidatus Micrarchaeota archaeon]|nr:HEAT repeat domain-containing protein [Candidatus Micrarchaeota archaeon]
MAEQTTRKEIGNAGNVKPVDGKDLLKAKAEPSMEEKVERLIRWLHSPMDKMPYYAIQELYGMGKEGMPALIEALSHSNCSIRANAACILSKNGDPSALEHLETALCDPNRAVSAVAEMAIFEITKRNIAELEPERVKAIAERISGSFGRELERMLGKDVPEPERSRCEDEDI